MNGVSGVFGAEPSDIDSLARMAECELRQGRFEAAARHCERVLAVRPHDAAAWHRHAIALLELGEAQRAVVSLDRALRLSPGHSDLLQDKALALSRLFRREEALSCYEESIRHRPVAEQDFHRLALLVELGRDREVARLAEALVALHPGRPDLRVTLAWARLWLGQVEEALTIFDRMVAAAPDADTAVRMHAAAAHLLAGRFERGWQLHESRLEGPSPLIPARDGPPQWRGSPSVAGRTVLVYAEQGVGDSLQFCRYVPLLRAMGAQVVLEAAPPLHALLRSLGPDLALAAPGDRVRADLQCPMMSLPFAFRTGLDTIPAQVPYLRPPQRSIQAWRERFGVRRRFRIGLACSGNARHGSDRRRSIPLERLAPWLQAGCEFHLLQPDVRVADEAFLRDSGIHDHRSDLTDLAETAALTCCMDLVISVDTAIAHLAGALGRPVWILLSKPSEWRWLLDRGDSPWYPSARLFRMSERGQWDGPIEAVGTALAAKTHGLG